MNKQELLMLAALHLGDENQKGRQAHGKLPEEEVRDLLRDRAFNDLTTEGYYERYRHLEEDDLEHDSDCVFEASGSWSVTGTREPDSWSRAAYSHFMRVSSIVANSVSKMPKLIVDEAELKVEIVEHYISCMHCQNETSECSIAVSLFWEEADVKVGREYIIPAEEAK